MTGLPLLALQMLAATGVVVGGAHFLTRAADFISLRTGLGHSFVGVILLATATSLPELGTGVSAITLYNQPDLAMGAVFGSNLFNLFIIVLLDMAWRRGPLLHSVSGTAKLITWLGIAVIALGTTAVWLHHATTFTNKWHLAPTSWTILVVFLLAMYWIYRHEKTETRTPKGGTWPEVESVSRNGMSLGAAIGVYAAAAVTVILGSVWLSRTGDALSRSLGLGASFVGTQFLALCTSLPEVATSFAALRMNAPTLAVTNVLGSNIFNMGFITFVNDAAYSQGSIWSAVAPVHAVTGILGVSMSAIVLLGLARVPKGAKPQAWISRESVLLVILYVVSSIVIYELG